MGRSFATTTVRRGRWVALALGAVLTTGLLAAPSAQAQQFGFQFLWGSMGAGQGQFSSPRDVAVDAAGNSYVADLANGRVQKFDQGGVFLDEWTTLDNTPHGIEVAPDGSVLVVDANTLSDHVQRYDQSGNLLDSFGPPGTLGGQLAAPFGITTDPSGRVFVAEGGNERVSRFSPTGEFQRAWGFDVDMAGGPGFEICMMAAACKAGIAGTGDGQFSQAEDVAVGSNRLYTIDSASHRVQAFDLDGAFINKWGRNGGDGTFGTGNGEFQVPRGIATDPDGDVFVFDTTNSRLQKFDPFGVFLFAFGMLGTGNGAFDAPWRGGTDCRGNVYVAESDNNRIQRLGEAGAGSPPCQTAAPPGGAGGGTTATLDIGGNAALRGGGTIQAGSNSIPVELECLSQTAFCLGDLTIDAAKPAQLGAAAGASAARKPGGKARRVLLGAFTFFLRPGQKATVAIPLSKRGRKLLKRKRNVAAQLRIVMRPGGTGSLTAVRRISRG